jgi:hypothetical protein
MNDYEFHSKKEHAINKIENYSVLSKNEDSTINIRKKNRSHCRPLSKSQDPKCPLSNKKTTNY